MAKYQWSEVFTSIEGEGPYSGTPTIYVRFTKCNFTCRGFNNPDDVEITNDVLGFDPAEYTKLQDIPTIEIGCDSIYSWDNRFKHMWIEGDENDLADAILDVLPQRRWVYPTTNTKAMLSLTGGEPTLRAKTIPTLLNHPDMDELKWLLFESNCSVPLTKDFIQDLNNWVDDDPRMQRRIIWSNSPKLSVSGEPWEKAINPSVAVMQNEVFDADQYFKFVCGPNERDFDEVLRAMEAYWDAGIPCDGNNIFVMPVSCTLEQQDDIAAQVADMCIERGLTYCHRIHTSVYGNEVGT
jgi:organic radical activating enzyme